MKSPSQQEKYESEMRARMSRKPNLQTPKWQPSRDQKARYHRATYRREHANEIMPWPARWDRDPAHALNLSEICRSVGMSTSVHSTLDPAIIPFPRKRSRRSA
jgi:hypothetical protein